MLVVKRQRARGLDLGVRQDGANLRYGGIPGNMPCQTVNG